MTDPSEDPSAPAPVEDRRSRFVLALLPPVVAVLAQLALQSHVERSVWFLLYPAVFLSSWIGGLRAGVVASALSALSVLWFLLPPDRAFPEAPGHYLAAGVFFATGVVFGVFHDRLRRASDRTARALASAERTNERLRELDQTLRARNADLDRAQSVAKVGSWRLDVRRNELVWSDEGYRIFGVSPGTPMGYEGFLACVHPDDRPFVDRAWKAALRGQPYDIEHRVVANGSVKWVREKAELELDEQGALIGGIGITHDITERKQREEALREARERFELALRGADLGTWDWNIDSGEVVFNARWAEMRGFRLDEVRPHVDSWMSRVHPEDWPTIQKRLDDYFHGRSPEYEVEHRARTKSGEWIWILDRGAVFARDGRGRPIRMVGTELDITARKRLEREQKLLAEVGAAFAATLEYEETLTNIARLAAREIADFCIVDVLEENEKDVRGRKIVSRDAARAGVCERLAAIDLDRSRPHLMSAAIETRRPVLIDHVSPDTLRGFAQSEEHLGALEALEPRSMMILPLLAHGALLGAIALVSSSESRTYGPADLRLGEELAVRAALAIDNARLYRAARRAIESRDDVLGIVAHDLRNPLNTVTMTASLLRRPGAEPERRSHRPAEGIARAANRMSRLIDDLLDITRVEAGELSVERARVPTAVVISEALEAQRALAQSASIELHRDVPQELPDVWADRDRLLQVFENLIGNAIKFTGPGGRITVGGAPRDGEVVFWVADAGPGIPGEDLPHVFDRFWQAARARRAGAGLGLAIVKGLVDAHGGRVWVESTLGLGATFFFAIPTAPRPAQRPPERAPRAA